MRTILTTITCIFIGWLAATSVRAEVDQEHIPARGVASSVPAVKWDYGFLTGNGRMGAIVYGQTVNETIVFNHGRLYLPQPHGPIVDLGQSGIKHDSTKQKRIKQM